MPSNSSYQYNNNKSVELLSQIRKKVVVDPIPDELLDTPHSARYGVSAPKKGATRIPEHERNASSLSSGFENYHIFLQGQSKTLSLYVIRYDIRHT